MKFRIYSEETDYGRRRRLTILLESAEGIVGVVEPLRVRHSTPGREEPYTWDRPVEAPEWLGASAARLDARMLMQAFLDHAWDIGMRPTGAADADTTKQIAAKDAHLADMQRLVFEHPRIFMTPPAPEHGTR